MRAWWRKRYSVLVVDDEPDIRAVVKSILEPGPFDPIWEAADGETALQIAFGQQPDLIVLDYHMPGMDGEAVANGLKLISSGTRVLVLTSVMKEPPPWGHGFLDKLDIARLPGVLELMVKDRPERRRRRDD